MNKIRLNKTDSIHSENKENGLEINLQSTFKHTSYNNIRETIDSYQVYKDERFKSERYRLILTINPFCTNVLFNPFTEIVKYIPLNNGVKIERINDYITVNGIDGNSTPKRVQFIANTIYSNEENGYIYYPGYDMFDNHILRCKAFNVINDAQTKTGRKNQDFNTLSDFARDMDGKTIETAKRSDGARSKPKIIKKHVYNVDTLMSFEDSINYNLTEQDGWLGFSNTTKLETYNSKNELSNWCRVLNDRSSSEFVQMYPDRTLFSFTPNYNNILNRMEYNWDILITYPFENDYSFDLVNFKDGINALKLYSANIQNGLSGEKIVMFRSMTKHNLIKNNYIQLMWRFKTSRLENNEYKTETEYFICDNTYRIANVGTLKNEKHNYYFYIDDKSLIDEINESIADKVVVNEKNKTRAVTIEDIDFYFQKITNDLPSKYYFRKFKKIDYDGDILAKEQYNLGFATTVYNDGITQVTFTDNIDFTDLTDNLGRPVCQFFITILKTNKGNKEWYTNYEDAMLAGEKAKNVEASHCFTKLTDGLVLHCEANDFFDDDSENKQEKNANIRFIGGEGHNWLSKGKSVLAEDSEWHGITKEQEWFYGDVVEFISSECKEYIIADVNYRFNTYQRENPAAIKRDKNMVYHEIEVDDYDFYQGNFAIKPPLTATQDPRNEGYFYRPHYPIRIKEEGEVEQGGHYTIRLRNVDVVQNEDVYLRVISMQTSNLNVNDTILLMDDVNGVSFVFKVVYITSKTTFLIQPVNGWFGDEGFVKKSTEIYDKALTWVDIAEHLRRGNDMFLRRRNSNIPSYAVLVGRNIFLWRKLYNNGEKDNSQLPEYIFTNNAFYVTPVINFYLRRQDPNGYFGLYRIDRQNPQDIAGETKKKTTNYEYKDTEKTEISC